MFWHGCLIAMSGLGAIAPASANPSSAAPIPVQARVFDVDYTVNKSALPLDSVELWYTADRGKTWHRYGLDEDRQSPISFHAPAEGLFGFFVVATNATASSSAPPVDSSEPHVWAFVDYTPPVVQLHPLRQTTLLGRPVIQVRWTAIDAYLEPRPVEIEYRRPPGEVWYAVTPDPLANTGRQDWRLPDDLLGPVTVRLSVRDKGGHVVLSETQTIEVTPGQFDPPGSARPMPVGSDVGGAVTGAKISDSARKRAEEFFREGLVYRDRGEIRKGIARMRAAARLNPRMVEAFAQMGGMLYRARDFDRALGAYNIILKQVPTHRGALQGAAMVFRQRNDYASAASRLREILRRNPKDAETWMHLGDIAVYRGDESTARESYIKAIEINPEATQIIEDAHKRLALMAKVSRTYD